MKMEKKKVKNNNNDDLKFTPLDINPSLNIGNEKLNSITPPNTLDGISINSDCNNIYIGFPPLGLTSSKYSPLMTNSSLLNSTSVSYTHLFQNNDNSFLLLSDY